jgi:hypothetical protein
MLKKISPYFIGIIAFILSGIVVIYGVMFTLIQLDQLPNANFFTQKEVTPEATTMTRDVEYVQENLPDYKKASDNPEISSQRYGREILAGLYSQYVIFTQEGFENAIADKKIIFLEFYSEWDTDSIKQEPEIIEAFDALKRTDVVGFRVNYRDTQTDSYEESLAQKYSINNSISKIILKDNKKVSYFPYDWTRYQIINELNKF